MEVISVPREWPKYRTFGRPVALGRSLESRGGGQGEGKTPQARVAAVTPQEDRRIMFRC